MNNVPWDKMAAGSKLSSLGLDDEFDFDLSWRTGECKEASINVALVCRTSRQDCCYIYLDGPQMGLAWSRASFNELKIKSVTSYLTWGRRNAISMDYYQWRYMIDISGLLTLTWASLNQTRKPEDRWEFVPTNWVFDACWWENSENTIPEGGKCRERNRIAEKARWSRGTIVHHTFFISVEFVFIPLILRIVMWDYNLFKHQI